MEKEITQYKMKLVFVLSSTNSFRFLSSSICYSSQLIPVLLRFFSLGTLEGIYCLFDKIWEEFSDWITVLVVSYGKFESNLLKERPVRLGVVQFWKNYRKSAWRVSRGWKLLFETLKTSISNFLLTVRQSGLLSNIPKVSFFISLV